MMMSRRLRTWLWWSALAMAGTVALVPGVLRAAEPANPSSRLDPLLDRTAATVETSLQRLSDVACKETVSQVKFGKNGKVDPVLSIDTFFVGHVVSRKLGLGHPLGKKDRLLQRRLRSYDVDRRQ